MTRRAQLLLAAIGLAILIGIVGWIVRYQPLGPAGPMGTPLASNAAAASGWTPVGEAPFERLEMATAVHEDRVWLAGGLAPDGGVVDALSVFEPASGKWSEGAALPEAVHHAAMASDGRNLYLVGGYVASGQPTAAVRIFDPSTKTWREGPALPEARAAGALAFDGARLVYGGGVGPGGVRGEVFALEGGEWLEIGELARPREHLAAATDRAGGVWLMGGRQGGLDRNVGDVEVVQGGSVSLVASLTPRGGVAAFYIAGMGACLTGGEAPSFALATVECVNDAGEVTALPSMTQRRHGHGVGVVGGIAYALLGGEIQGLNASSTVESLPLE